MYRGFLGVAQTSSIFHRPLSHDVSGTTTQLINQSYQIEQFRCCMGLPELNCPANVDFLRHSLMYDKIGQDDPREAFERVFDDVAKADWSIQLNWFFHSVRHM
jgi:hypothetical protein